MNLTLAQLEQMLPTISWQVALRNPQREAETESDLDSDLGPRLNQVWMQATGLIERCDGTVVAVPVIRRFVGRAGRETGGPLFAAGEVVAEAVREVQLLDAVGSVRELARVLSRMDRLPEWRR